MHGNQEEVGMFLKERALEDGRNSERTKQIWEGSTSDSER
jgi:hypothetical protein